MDFLKTLLLYMSLTFASSVGGAPTPAPTQAPTPAPSAIVETSPEAVVTPPVSTPEVAAETPAPTLTPAPAPTMTPNSSYRLLRQGSRGDQVTRLQERLKELGYLEGEVDGAYGPQTRRAVQRFQYYHGLQQDGEAGEITQTVLFESEAVVAAVTPTPAPTSTPDTTIAPPEEEASPSASPTLVPALEGAPVGELSEVADSQMVVNGGGVPLADLVMEDGVQVEKTLRVYLDAAGQPLVDAAFLAQCLENWSWEAQEGAYTCQADGYTLVFRLTLNAAGDVEDAQLTVDGVAVPLEAGEIRRSAEGMIYLSPAVLEKAIGATYVWEAEERTLMLNYVSKSLAQVDG